MDMTDGRPIEWTDEQKDIIDHPLAPLRVAAGAGTGKTTTIAARLRRLVESGAVESSRALGITFTNKAAAQLSTSINRADDPFDDIEVATYHAFAYRILQEFGAFVGIERTARVITPGFVRQLMYDAVRDGSYEHLDLTAAGHRIEEAVNLAAQAADNLVSPSDIDPALRDAAEGVNARRRELVQAVRRYEERKQRYQLLDYGDLVKRAHELVTNIPLAREAIRSRYDVVLLDEYQDTNPAQRLLFTALFRDEVPITAVGDADQTIYEWRGASRANFEKFPEHFPNADGSDAASLPLTINWRSDHAVIAAANAVRAQIRHSAPKGNLRPRDKAGDGRVSTLWFDTAAEEANWIAEELGGRNRDGEQWRDMAVIFRKHAQIPMVRDAVSGAGIPVQVVSLGGLLNVPEVNDLYAWMRLLADPTDSPALARILFGSSFMLSMTDLAPHAEVLRTLRGSGPGDVSMLEAIVDNPLEGEPARLDRFRRAYRTLLQVAQGVTLVDLARRILGELGFWAEIDAMEPTAGISARLNVYRFLDLIEGWSPIEGQASLPAFIAYLSTVEDTTASAELDLADLGTANAVSLITAHRAKGLEFSTVFLPALTDQTFPSRSQGFDDPFRSPQWLPHAQRLDVAELIEVDTADERQRLQALRDRHLDQEWRTAYVAVTRARFRLYASGAFWYPGAKNSKKPSELWSILDGLEVSDRLTHSAEPGPRPEWLPSDPDWSRPAPDPLFPDGWVAAIHSTVNDPDHPRSLAGDLPAYDAEVEQLNLMLGRLAQPEPTDPSRFDAETSVTGLVTYAICPRRYYWAHVDRLPRRPSRSLRRGVELHRKIELHNRGIVQLDLPHDDTYDISPDERTPAAGAFEAFRNSPYGRTRPHHVEAPFRLLVGGTSVRGRIDAIYVTADGWDIVDFKSGNPGPGTSRPTQLQAYAVAAFDGAVSTAVPERVHVSFVFLGDGLEVESTSVTENWLNEARSQLNHLVTGIEDEQFGPEPSPACHSCDFVKFCEAGLAWVEQNP